jgi:hypothetical protein
MYIEIGLLSLAAVMAGFSFAGYWGTKKFYALTLRASTLAIANAEVAAARAEDVLVYHKASETTLRDTLSVKENVDALVLKAAEQVQAARVHSANAASFELSAKEHVIEAAEQVQMAATHVQTAESHAVVASKYVDQAAGHAAKTNEHAASVGALSKSIADIAAQTHVRLVHRTDYSSDGSNVGRR